MIEQGLLAKIKKIDSELIKAIECFYILSNGSTDMQKLIAEKKFEEANKKIANHKINLLTALNNRIPIGATLFLNKESYSIGEKDLEDSEIKSFLMDYRFYKDHV